MISYKDDKCCETDRELSLISALKYLCVRKVHRLHGVRKSYTLEHKKKLKLTGDLFACLPCPRKSISP